MNKRKKSTETKKETKEKVTETVLKISPQTNELLGKAILDVIVDEVNFPNTKHTKVKMKCFINETMNKNIKDIKKVITFLEMIKNVDTVRLDSNFASSNKVEYLSVETLEISENTLNELINVINYGKSISKVTIEKDVVY